MYLAENLEESHRPFPSTPEEKGNSEQHSGAKNDCFCYSFAVIMACSLVVTSFFTVFMAGY